MHTTKDNIIIKEINTALTQNHFNKYVSLLKIQHLESHSQINYKLTDNASKIRGMKDQVLNTILEVSSKYDCHILADIDDVS